MKLTFYLPRYVFCSQWFETCGYFLQKEILNLL